MTDVVKMCLRIEKKFKVCNRRNMRKFHWYNLKCDVNGPVKDENKVPLEMIWPDLKANLKITQLWKVGLIDSVNHEYNIPCYWNSNMQNISSQLIYWEEIFFL